MLNILETATSPLKRPVVVRAQTAEPAGELHLSME